MRIVCIGGGPAGLYFALLMKRQHPEHRITVVERNRPFDTFGWGVVFSDATMQSMRQWDPETAAKIEDAFTQCIERAKAAGQVSADKDARQYARFMMSTIFSMRAMTKLKAPKQFIDDARTCVFRALAA